MRISQGKKGIFRLSTAFDLTNVMFLVAQEFFFPWGQTKYEYFNWEFIFEPIVSSCVGSYQNKQFYPQRKAVNYGRSKELKNNNEKMYKNHPLKTCETEKCLSIDLFEQECRNS